MCINIHGEKSWRKLSIWEKFVKISYVFNTGTQEMQMIY